MALIRPLSLFATALICAAPALADPTIGLGVSLSFGKKAPQTGIGLRLFSDDRQDSVVGAVGMDYMLDSQSWRGTLGATYLGITAILGWIWV